MAEQGLKAVIYPEVDDVAIQDMMRKISESVSNTYIPIGMDVNTSSSSSGGGSSSSSGSGTDNGEEAIAKGTRKGLRDSANMDPQVAERKAQPIVASITVLTQNIGGAVSSVSNAVGSVGKLVGEGVGKAGLIGVALGVGAIGVVEVISKIFRFLEDSSPPLKKVMDLFGQAFNLIWMPIGTILAIELMPLLRSTFEKVGGFIASAVKLYESDGWAGVIGGAIELSFSLLGDILGNEKIWGALGNIILGVLSEFNPPALLMRLLFGSGSPMVSLIDTVELISKTLNLLDKVFTGRFDELGDAFDELGKVWDRVGTKITDGFGDIFEKVFTEWLPKFPPIASLLKILEYIEDIWEKITGKNVKETIGESATDVVRGWNKVTTGDVGGGLLDIAKGATPVGFLGKSLGWWADGGIITQPTLGVAGEAGPEAIVPLNKLNQVANDMRTINGGNTNIITININGNNAQDIGEKVQKVLDKTVGKANSKLMWW